MNLTDDQNKAWGLLCGEENVFLTGAAGSGKSFLIREFIKGKNSKEFPVLASTGAAAVLIGGRTFHSFMGLGIMEGGVEKTVQKALNDKSVIRRIKKVSGFVVDEVSMLSGQTLQAAEWICRRAKNIEAPWGGLRIIAVGDFAQLPPIQRGYGKKPWAFLDPVWHDTDFKSIKLGQNMRSSNSDFLSILEDVRKGIVSPNVKNFLDEKTDFCNEEFDGTRLFPRKNQTEEFNLLELEKLPTEEFTFETTYTGHQRYIDQLKKHSPLAEKLVVKEDALIMLRQNDPKQRWVNGTTGHVRKIADAHLTIELLNGRVVKVDQATFSLLNAEGIPVAGATNFPISLAYAATIHKAQGMTLDRLMVNLNALWEPGQAYVALSRVIDPENLYVQNWQPSSIKADPIVESFYNSL